jgi:hypothetical protein
MKSDLSGFCCIAGCAGHEQSCQLSSPPSRIPAAPAAPGQQACPATERLHPAILLDRKATTKRASGPPDVRAWWPLLLDWVLRASWPSSRKDANNWLFLRLRRSLHPATRYHLPWTHSSPLLHSDCGSDLSTDTHKNRCHSWPGHASPG